MADDATDVWAVTDSPVASWESAFPEQEVRDEIAASEAAIQRLRTRIDQQRRLLVLMGREPDKPLRGGRGGVGMKYAAVLNELRANPGIEREIATMGSDNSASGLANRIKTGHYGPGVTARRIGRTVFATAVVEAAS
jgi:hypothetical protein